MLYRKILIVIAVLAATLVSASSRVPQSVALRSFDRGQQKQIPQILEHSDHGSESRSGALAAGEVNGSLCVHRPGLDEDATLTLDSLLKSLEPPHA